MTPSFNLVDDPWIPCLTADGDHAEFSLRQTLLRAHELREIADASPLIVAALHRLLLAVLHRVFGPSGYDAWSTLWENGRWPQQPLDDYLDEWRDRFDLFDEQRPFFQADDDRVKPKSILNLIHSSNNNPTLFDHTVEETGRSLSAAAAARELCAAQCFHAAGLSGLPQKFRDAAWTRGAVFLAQGDSLFASLALNLVRYPDREGRIPSRSDDKPAWEMDDVFEPEREVPLGYLDYLTWHNLRVRLLPSTQDSQLAVATITVGPGLSLATNILDPMKLYREDKKTGFKVVRFSEDRALWRNAHTFFALQRQPGRSPASLEWLAELAGDRLLSSDARLRYLALGMSTNQAKVFFYQHQRWPLPTEYLQVPELGLHLERGITLAEETASALNWSLRELAQLILSPNSDRKDARKPRNKEDVQPLIMHWGSRREYWGDLEPHFWEYVLHLPDDPDAAFAIWANHLKQAARHALDHASALAGRDPEAMKAAVAARRLLNGRLKKLFDGIEERSTTA